MGLQLAIAPRAIRPAPARMASQAGAKAIRAIPSGKPDSRVVPAVAAHALGTTARAGRRTACATPVQGATVVATITNADRHAAAPRVLAPLASTLWAMVLARPTRRARPRAAVVAAAARQTFNAMRTTAEACAAARLAPAPARAAVLQLPAAARQALVAPALALEPAQAPLAPLPASARALFPLARTAYVTSSRLR